MSITAGVSYFMFITETRIFWKSIETCPTDSGMIIKCLKILSFGFV